jgi:hypothetical protein
VSHQVRTNDSDNIPIGNNQKLILCIS